jgi:hypothetical protein
MLASLSVLLLPAGVAVAKKTAPKKSAKKGVAEITLSHSPANLAATSPTHDIAIDPSTDTVVVTGSSNLSSQAAGRVWIINGKQKKVVATLEIAGAAKAGVAVDPSTDTFYLIDAELPNTSGEPGGIVVIDGHTDKVTATISLPGAADYSFDAGIGVDTTTDTIYADGPSYSVDAIDGSTNALTATIDETDYPGMIAVDSVDDIIYEIGGAAGGSDGLWVIDGQSDTIEGSTPAEPATVVFEYPPSGVAVNSKSGSVYLASGTESGTAVSIVHHGARSVAHTTTIKDGNPTDYDIAVDSATNSAYVSNSSQIAGCPGFVSEISGKTNKVTATVNGIKSAGAIAVDEANNTIWVTNGGKIAEFSGGYSRKAKPCGESGITLGG